MPGRYVTDHQMRLLMTLRRDHSVLVAAAKSGRLTATVCGCPLFGKHTLRSFGGVFDRTCVRPVSVALDDATGRCAVRKAGVTSVQRAASARAP